MHSVTIIYYMKIIVRIRFSFFLQFEQLFEHSEIKFLSHLVLILIHD